MPKVIYSDVDERERMRRIRSRFQEAKKAGLTQDQAVEYANSSGPMPKPKPAAPVPKSNLKFDPNVEHVTFVGMEAPVTTPTTQEVTPDQVASEPATPKTNKWRDVIPQDYEGLPWKTLIELTQKVEPGVKVRSRAHANSIIAAALQSQ